MSGVEWSGVGGVGEPRGARALPYSLLAPRTRQPRFTANIVQLIYRAGVPTSRAATVA